MNYFTLLAQTTSSRLDSAETTTATAAGLGIGILMLMVWLLVMGLAITGLVYWIIALIHVLQHPDVKDRVMWIVILLLAGTLAGVIYYFVVKRPYDRGGMRELPSILPPGH